MHVEMRLKKKKGGYVVVNCSRGYATRHDATEDRGIEIDYPSAVYASQSS